MSRWRGLFAGTGPRVVAGVMSGTSLDGIDVAILKLTGSGRELESEFLGAASRSFPIEVVAALREAAEAATWSVDHLSLLGVRLADCYADAVRDALADSGMDESGLDLVGCHGQTIRHQPETRDFAGGRAAATLQLGNGPTLSARLGVPVVSDFRSADIALGGQGAPLVPYFDYAMLGSEVENRVALNLGGIANLTALPAAGGPADVIAFDTGPGNMVMDALCQRLIGRPFDQGGRLAASGEVLAGLLEEALRDPFFARSPPKSAGRKSAGAGFGAAYADHLIRQAGEAMPANLLATAVAITVESVGRAVDRFVPFQPDVVIASGGGTRNDFLMAQLASRLGRVAPSSEFGVDAGYKEAMAFAILAHEAVNGVETGMPSVTGASRAAVLGAISWP